MKGTKELVVVQYLQLIVVRFTMFNYHESGHTKNTPKNQLWWSLLDHFEVDFCDLNEIPYLLIATSTTSPVSDRNLDSLRSLLLFGQPNSNCWDTW